MKRIFFLCICLICSNVLADEQEQTRSSLAANFQQADSDGNQALTKKEFKDFVAANAKANIGRFAMIQKRGAHDMIFSRIDSDGDGEITLQEVQKLRNNR